MERALNTGETGSNVNFRNVPSLSKTGLYSGGGWVASGVETKERIGKNIAIIQ